MNTLPKIKHVPLQGDHFKRKWTIFQPSFFRGYVNLIFRGDPKRMGLEQKCDFRMEWPVLVLYSWKKSMGCQGSYFTNIHQHIFLPVKAWWKHDVRLVAWSLHVGIHSGGEHHFFWIKTPLNGEWWFSDSGFTFTFVFFLPLCKDVSGDGISRLSLGAWSISGN